MSHWKCIGMQGVNVIYPKISRHDMHGVKGARDSLLIDCVSDPGKWKLLDEDLKSSMLERKEKDILQVFSFFFFWVNCGSCRFWIAPLFYLSVKNEQSLRLRRCQSTADCLSTALSGWAAKRPVWVCVCVLPVWRKAITDLLTCSRHRRLMLFTHFSSFSRKAQTLLALLQCSVFKS